jgi:hypothetical protein
MIGKMVCPVMRKSFCNGILSSFILVYEMTSEVDEAPLFSQQDA